MTDAYVYVAAFGLLSVPRSISDLPNVSVRYLSHVPIIGFLAYFLQIIGLILSISSIDTVVTTTSHCVLQPIIACFVRFVTNCKFVLDVAPFDWEKSKNGVCRACKHADHVISRTRAMQVLLKLKGVESSLLKTECDSVFKPNQSRRELLSPGLLPLVAIPFYESKPNIYIDKARFCPVYFGPFDRKDDGDRFIAFEDPDFPSYLGMCDFGVVTNGSPLYIDIADEVLMMKACGLKLVALKEGCISEEVDHLVDSLDDIQDALLHYK